MNLKVIGMMIWLLVGANPLLAQEDALSKFFSKYMEDDRYSRVYISPKMMQMAGGFLKSEVNPNDPQSKDLGNLISKINGIRIISRSDFNGKPLFTEMKGLLNKNQYEDLMDVHDKGSDVKFMVREEKGRIKELLMIQASSTGFTALSMLGNFTYQDLNILADQTNLPGMDVYKNGTKKQK
jgi:hypothetical protein